MMPLQLPAILLYVPVPGNKVCKCQISAYMPGSFRIKNSAVRAAPGTFVYAEILRHQMSLPYYVVSFSKGNPNNVSNFLASLSLVAVVTKVSSNPRTLSTMLYSSSGNIVISETPKV